MAIVVIPSAWFFGSSVIGHSAGKATLSLDNFELTFEENFDVLDVSAWGPNTKWISHTPWSGDFGDAAFVDPRPAFPFVVKDGVLRIEARKGSDGYWRSGLLSSADSSGHGFMQQFGYFEMRAKLPKGPGLWPAFWLIANKDPDTSSEIDVIEHYGAAPAMYESVVHIWPKNKAARKYEHILQHQVPEGALYEDFHTYGMKMDEDWIIFYFDRKEVGRSPTQPENKRPMFILLNLAMGSGWPIENTPNPSFMYVDYVRAWKEKIQ